MANIITDKDEFLVYRYEVKDFKLYFTGDNNKIDSTDAKKDMRNETVKSIVIQNDYIGNIFPIIQLKMSCSAKLYYRIIKHKKDVVFYLRIQKYTTKNGSTEKSLYEDFIKGNFNLILDDDAEDLYSSVRKTNNGDNQDDEDLKEQAQEVEFYLFNSKLINSTTSFINNIIEESNITNALALIASKCGIKNLLMTKADNSTIYDEIRIPPMKLSQAMPYLDTMYGIHETGTIIFFDIKNSYIIKFDGRCSAWRNSEKKNTTILVPEAGSNTTQNCCSLKKYNDDNYYLVGDHETIEFTDKSVTDSTLYGSDIEIINNDDDSVEKTNKSEESNRTIIENPGLNKYFKKAYSKQKNALKKKIVVQFNDVDIEALQPNKKFNFVFEDTTLNKKYKGTYILVALEYGLFRSTANLNCTVKATFYFNSAD